MLAIMLKTTMMVILIVMMLVIMAEAIAVLLMLTSLELTKFKALLFTSKKKFVYKTFTK